MWIANQHMHFMALLQQLPEHIMPQQSVAAQKEDCHVSLHCSQA